MNDEKFEMRGIRVNHKYTVLKGYCIRLANTN